MLLNAHFMSWPKEFLLFSVNLPVALSGGYITYRLATQIFHSIMCTVKTYHIPTSVWVLLPSSLRSQLLSKERSALP